MGVTPQVTTQVEQADIKERIPLFCNEGRSKKDIADDKENMSRVIHIFGKHIDNHLCIVYNDI